MPDSNRFVDAALENGLLRSEQVEECREILQLSGAAASLQEILVNRGYLTPAEVGMLRNILAGQVVDGAQTVMMPPSGSGEAPPAMPVGGGRSQPAPKRRFGRYEIIERISQGGMGIIYKVRHPELDRVLALKVLLAGADATEDQVRRFQQEARATAGLQHRNIVPVHDVGVEGGQSYYTMNFIEGEPLHQVMERERISWQRALEITARLADALAHAHDHGIVHRDVKPANVIIDRDGEPMLTDFGLAKDLNARELGTRTGTSIGTPVYMSPEQASGRIRDIGPRSDIYSLGAVLYEMLTLRPPFTDDNPVRVMTQVVHEDPPRPRRLSPLLSADVETICLTAMDKDIFRRYADARALARDCRNALAGDPIEARPPTISYILVKRVRKHRAAVIAGTVAMLAVSVGFGSWLKRDIEDRAQVAALLRKADEAFEDGSLGRAKEAYHEVLGIDRDNPRTLARLEELKGAFQAEVERRAREEAELRETMRRQHELEVIAALFEEARTRTMSRDELEDATHTLVGMPGEHTVAALVEALAADTLQIREIAVVSLGWLRRIQAQEGEEQAAVLEELAVGPLVEMLRRPQPVALKLNVLRALSWIGGEQAEMALWREHRLGDHTVRNKGRPWFRRSGLQVIKELGEGELADARACLRRGCAWFALYKLDNAAEDLRAALRLDRALYEARLFLGSVFKMQALDALRRRKARDARIFLQRAYRLFDQVIAERPELAEAYLQRGLVHYNLGELYQGATLARGDPAAVRYAAAVADFTTALQRDPALEVALLDRGITYLKIFDAEQAAVDFRRLLAANPYQHVAWYYLGVAEMDQGRAQEAVDAYSRCIEQVPDFTSAYIQRLQALVQVNDYSNALVDVVKLTELGGTNDPMVDNTIKWVRWVLTGVMAASGRDGQTMLQFRSLVRQARRARFVNDLQEAERFYGEALATPVSGIVPALEKLGVLHDRGWVRFDRGAYDGAASDFREVVRAAGGLPEARYALGRALLAQRETEAAAAELVKCLRLVQEGRIGERLAQVPAGLVHVELARVRLRQGDRDKALRNLEAAVSLGLPNPVGLASDEEFAPLREEPRFQALLPGADED